MRKSMHIPNSCKKIHFFSTFLVPNTRIDKNTISLQMREISIDIKDKGLSAFD